MWSPARMPAAAAGVPFAVLSTTVVTLEVAEHREHGEQHEREDEVDAPGRRRSRRAAATSPAASTRPARATTRAPASPRTLPSSGRSSPRSAARAASSSRPIASSRRSIAGAVAHGRCCESAVQVARRRPVHAGDLHVAAERDRADPVLDAAAHRLDDRRPEAEIELPRRHPDGARGEEVPRLVDHHEQRQPDDRCD